MRKRNISTRLLLVLTTLSLQVQGQFIPKKPNVGVSAHRGAMPDLPENTLATYKAALAMQVNYIEIDVRTTKDHQLIILHDESLNRTTNGIGPVKEKTLAELKQLSAGKGFGKRFETERIPTLEEVCQLIHNWNETHSSQTNLYVDCKDVEPQALVKMLTNYKLLSEAVFYGSDLFLMTLRQVTPEARRMPSLNSENELAEKVKVLQPYAFDVRWQALNEGLVNRIHQQGIKVFSDALDHFEEPEQYRKAASMHIDVIQTDQISRVYQALAGHK